MDGLELYVGECGLDQGGMSGRSAFRNRSGLATQSSRR